MIATVLCECAKQWMEQVFNHFLTLKFNVRKKVANCGGGGMSMAVHQSLRWRCARGKDLVHNVQWVCTVHCAVHPSCNGAGTHHYQILCYVSNVPRKSELVFELAIEQWTAFTEGTYSVFIAQNVVFFLLTKARPLINVWGRFFSSPGRSSGNARKKLLWPPSRDLVMRAEKICRLYCDNAIQKQVKSRQSTLLRIDIKCNEIFHYP